MLGLAFITWFLVVVLSAINLEWIAGNAILVVFPVVVFLIHNVVFYRSETICEVVSIWCVLLFSLTIWLLDNHLCQQFHYFAVFHSIYHITLSSAIWWAGMLADSTLAGYSAISPVPG